MCVELKTYHPLQKRVLVGLLTAMVHTTGVTLKPGLDSLFGRASLLDGLF